MSSRTAVLMGRIYRPYDRDSVLAMNRPAPIEVHDVQVQLNTLKDTFEEYFLEEAEGELRDRDSERMLNEYNAKRQAAEPRFVAPPTYDWPTKKARTAPSAVVVVVGPAPRQGPVVNNNNGPAKQGGAGAGGGGIAGDYPIQVFDLSKVVHPRVDGIPISDVPDEARQTLQGIQKNPTGANPAIVLGAAEGSFRNLAAAVLDATSFARQVARDIPSAYENEEEWRIRKPVYEFAMGTTLAFLTDLSFMADPDAIDRATANIKPRLEAVLDNYERRRRATLNL